MWWWNPNSYHYMLHKSKELLLHEELLLLYSLLLLLNCLLLSLELILPGLKLSKYSSGLLGLASLILPHSLKDSK